MHAINLRSFYVLVAIISLVENKRYDIEEHCKLEYGLDLKSVLRNFRRSSDYLRILEMRVKEIVVYFTDVMYQSLDWNLNKMKLRIEADFGLNQTTTTRATPAPTTTTTLAQRTRFLRSKLNGRRQETNEQLTKAQEKINRVDTYPKLKSYLTADERNHYKEVGFEYAGDIIHATIHALGGSLYDDTVTPGSTRLTLPGQTSVSTTEHMLKHVPTEAPHGSKETATKIGPTKGHRYVLVSRFYSPIFGR